MTTAGDERQLDELLEYLKTARGFDFTSYKRASLSRRLEKRLSEVGIASYEAYIDYLEVHPDEFEQLFNTLLINVTGFFRDPQAWEYLANEGLPKVLRSVDPAQPIRVWSAGCATGEEAYTAAMLLAEALGPSEYLARVKIYATDIDNDALNRGRHATYSAAAVQDIPPNLLGKYFDQSNDSYTFKPELRRTVIFGLNDLLHHAPISRIDLLICRNTLMYFNSEAQARILSRFNFALRHGGLLFLGKAEMLLSNADYFVPIDLKRRFFAKVHYPFRPYEPSTRPITRGLGHWPAPSTVPDDHNLLRDAATQLVGPPQMILDAAGVLIMVNQAARALFSLADHDVGRPLSELTISYRPVELRSCIDKANQQLQSVVIRNVECPLPDGTLTFVDVSVTPLLNANNTPLGVSVTYVDTSDMRTLRNDLAQCNQERETAHEELQTTNEELQSTIEELETTNEELQSTNEELETMNEELQSTNEELRSSNEELSVRTDEIDSLNEFWRAVLGAITSALIVVDDELRVSVWNERAQEMWGLTQGETLGKHLLNLDFGLSVEQLAQPIKVVLSSGNASEVALTAINRRGRRFRCRIHMSLLPRNGTVTGGVVLMLEEEPDGGGDHG